MATLFLLATGDPKKPYIFFFFIECRLIFFFVASTITLEFIVIMLSQIQSAIPNEKNKIK
jgi:hypothetical protein